jgi:hypothetical protein
MRVAMKCEPDAGSLMEAQMDSGGCRKQKTSPHIKEKSEKSYALRGCVLLEWRLTALGLNPKGIERVSPEILEGLRSTCAACSHKQQCLDDMTDGINGSSWERYCLNAKTLLLLAATKEPDISIK